MNLQDLNIREATLADKETLLSIEQEVISAERPYNSSIKKNRAYYYDLEDLILGKDSRLLVGEIDGEIIATGYIQLRESKPSLEHQRHGYLGFMYVADRFRGLGLNKMIMEDLIEWGKRQGISDFYLNVYHENAAAVRAYEKSGFSGSLLEMKLNTNR